MSKLRAIGLVAAAVLAASPAWATSDTEDKSQTTFQQGEKVMGPHQLRVLGGMVANGIANRVGEATRGTGLVERAAGEEPSTVAGSEPGTGLSAGEQMTGMSAGSNAGRLGIWVSGGWTQYEDDLASTAYHGDAYNVLAGGDYQFNDRFIAGLALGYESSDVDTIFNNGNLNSDGFTIAPYAGYVLNRYFSIDVSGGYSWIDYGQRRTAAGGTVSAENDSNRWFGSANLNGFYAVDRVVLSGKVGYLYTEEEQEGYVESDGTVNTANTVDLGQLRAGGQVGYDLGKVQPYVTGSYVYDIQHELLKVGPGQAQPANDRSGFDVGGGIRFALSDRVSGGIQGTKHLGRENFDSTAVNGNLRIKF